MMISQARATHLEYLTTKEIFFDWKQSTSLGWMM